MSRRQRGSRDTGRGREAPARGQHAEGGPPQPRLAVRARGSLIVRYRTHSPANQHSPPVLGTARPSCDFSLLGSPSTPPVRGVRTPYTWSNFGTKSSSSFSSSISLESCFSALETSSSPETTHVYVSDRTEVSSFYLKSAFLLLFSMLAPAAPRGPLTTSWASPVPPAWWHRARQPPPNS